MSSDSNGHSCSFYTVINNNTYGKDVVSRLSLLEL